MDRHVSHLAIRLRLGAWPCWSDLRVLLALVRGDLIERRGRRWLAACFTGAFAMSACRGPGGRTCGRDADPRGTARASVSLGRRGHLSSFLWTRRPLALGVLTTRGRNCSNSIRKKNTKGKGKGEREKVGGRCWRERYSTRFGWSSTRSAQGHRFAGFVKDCDRRRPRCVNVESKDRVSVKDQCGPGAAAYAQARRPRVTCG